MLWRCYKDALSDDDIRSCDKKLTYCMKSTSVLVHVYLCSMELSTNVYILAFEL